MGKFFIAKKTNRMKLLMITAEKFSCLTVKQVLAIVESQIDWNEIQKIFWDKDGQNMSGNIFIDQSNISLT